MGEELEITLPSGHGALSGAGALHPPSVAEPGEAAGSTLTLV